MMRGEDGDRDGVTGRDSLMSFVWVVTVEVMRMMITGCKK